MVLEARELQAGLERLGVKDLALVAGGLADALEERRIQTVRALETPKPEVLTIEQIQAEIERQVKIYQEAGFARHLGVAKSKLKDQLMGLALPQPEAFRGRFDIPAVVIGARISPEDQYKMIDIDYYLGGLNLEDWKGDPQGYTTPQEPKLVWMQDGRINLKKSVDDVRAGLAVDERGANIYDGVGLLVARPGVLNDHYIDLPGTRVGSGHAPNLKLWRGRSEVCYYFTDDAGSRWGSASCGRI